MMKWLSLLARLGLAAVWLSAGFAKAFNPFQSVQAVKAFQLLPEWAAQWVGWGLPWFEIALGLLLVAGLLTRTTAVVSAGLLVAFIIGVAAAWARGLAIDCGCFGGGGQVAPDQTQYVQELLRDLGFLALAAWLIWKPKSAVSVDSLLADPEPEEVHEQEEEPAALRGPVQ